MKKAFNLRIPVLSAVAMVTGIAFSAFLAYFKSDGIFILIPAVPLLAACAFFAIFKRSASKSLIFLFITFCFLFGAIYAYCKYFSFCQSDIPLNELTEISGRVEEVGVASTGTRYLILSRVSAYGTPLSGKICVYLGPSAGDYCQRGYEVTFFTTVQKQPFIEYGEISYRATRNIKYYCNVYGGMQAKYRFSLFGEIYSVIENTLYSSLDKETAAVCLAMLTGEDGGISRETLSSFRYGGVAHVFAVSGLHIGVIYGILSALFKKLRLNKFVNALFKIAIISLYAGICGFSASSVRAITLCSVASISKCVNRKYDGLNALALAAVLLLSINPFYLFQAGFVLSFGAILGINLLQSRFKKLLFFLPKKVKSAVAVSWSAQAGVLPAQITSFGYASAAGLILNVIFVPLISLIYVALFVCTVFCAVIPALSAYVLPVAVVPLQFIINIIAVCGFENALITGTYSNWLYIPYIAIIAGVTDKLNFGAFFRGALVSVSTLAIILGCVFSSGKAGASASFAAGYSGGAVSIKTQSGNVLIVTQSFEPRTYLNAQFYDAVVVVGGDDELSVLSRLDVRYNFVCMWGGAIPISGYGNASAIYADEFEVCGVEFNYSNEGAVLNVCVDDAEFRVAQEDEDEEFGANLQRGQMNLYCYDDYALLYYGESSYDLKMCGTAKFTLGGGRISKSFVAPKE